MNQSEVDDSQPKVIQMQSTKMTAKQMREMALEYEREKR